MFSPPSRDNHLKMSIEENSQPLINYDNQMLEMMYDRSQFSKSTSFMILEDELSSPFFKPQLQRFNSEVIQDFSLAVSPTMGEGNLFLRSRRKQIPSINSDEYEIIKLIGRGSKGRVFKVKSLLDGMYYAAKRVPSTENIHALLQDGQVQFYGCIPIEDELMIIMEHCDHSLKSKLKSRFFESEIRQVLIDVCHALLKFPDRHGALHGGNILLSKQMKYKVTDYQFSNSITHYQAPEINKTKKADIYSLGYILLELMMEREIPVITHALLSKFDNLQYYSMSLKQIIRKMVRVVGERPDEWWIIQQVQLNESETLSLLVEHNRLLQKQVDDLSEQRRGSI